MMFLGISKIIFMLHPCMKISQQKSQHFRESFIYFFFRRYGNSINYEFFCESESTFLVPPTGIRQLWSIKPNSLPNCLFFTTSVFPQINFPSLDIYFHHSHLQQVEMYRQMMPPMIYWIEFIRELFHHR